MTYITIWIRRLPLAVQASLRAASAVCGLRVFAWPTVPAGPYPDQVTELPIDDAAGLASAAHDAAERGQVVYLTDPQGRRIARSSPPASPPRGRLPSKHSKTRPTSQPERRHSLSWTPTTGAPT